jgi:1,4-alpha-glucan branching enzyme
VNVVSLAPIQTFATNWQQKSYTLRQEVTHQLGSLAATYLDPFVEGLTDTKPLAEIKRVGQLAVEQQFSWMLRIALQIAKWVTQYIFRSHHAYYEEMLALDMKARQVHQLTMKLNASTSEHLHDRVLAGQMVELSQALTKSQIEKIYKDIHAAFSLSKIVAGLLQLRKIDTATMTPESFEILDASSKEALIEIAERAGKHELADQIRPLSRLNPVVLHQLEEGNPSLIDLAIEDYENLLKCLNIRYDVVSAESEDEVFYAEKLKQPGILAKVMRPEADDIYQAGIDRVGTAVEVSAVATKLKESHVRVTHVGVEYASFLKQGGLGEALEGLAEAMQSEGGEVRLLFPLYSSIQKAVTEKEGVVKGSFINADGEEVTTYTLMHRGVEIVFIEHEDFALDKKSPNIYDGDVKSRSRFARFCQCASSWLYQNRDALDVIHLHDWHVATIARTLATDYPQAWEEGKMPCVFTAHNNSRAAQGRCSDELAVGAYAYGLALNPMLEALRWSDMVTTVSEVFAREIQTPERGEGIDPVMKRLALGGRLVGILNGSNPWKWDPARDTQLAQWSLDGSTVHDLRCSSSNPEQVVEKKKLAKSLFAQWIEQQRPLLTEEDSGKQLFNSIDPAKPLFGVVTRYDSYQKGLDFYEAMIESTLAEGGQIALIGSQEDSVATEILNALVVKYAKTKGVVIIRDEKVGSGKFRFQQGGSDSTPAIGSIARLAFDVMFMTPKYEPSGLTQYEGWGYGSLVLASNTGGLAESVTTPEQNAENFSGWLFNRALGPKDLQRAVTEAMTYFKSTSEEAHAAKVAALMEEAKLYSWTCSERRPSPVNQYFAVYDKAIQRAKGRAAKPLSHRLADRFKTAELEKQEALARLNPQESEMALHAFLGAGNRAAQAIQSPLARTMPIAFGEGVCRTLHKQLGPQKLADGTFRLTVMAPKALVVSVVVYNDDRTVKSVFSLEKYEGGVWQTGLDLPAGTKYRLLIDGKMKLDPYARAHARDDQESMMYSVLYHDDFKWTDKSFVETRAAKSKLDSANILEVFPHTLACEKGVKTWAELAPALIEHAKVHGYTHIELMGVLNFPYLPSMGYQPISHFSTDYRLGTPEDFKALVNALHEAGLFVVVDFVPGHFAKDPSGMANFDGSALYEISGFQKFSAQAIAFQWGHHMNFGSELVQAHLLSSANWLLDELHVDGLRVDAIRSMLNHYNSSASKRFLQHLNAMVQDKPGCFTFAEDYSGSDLVLKPHENMGLGFNGRWNVGWKHHAMGLLADNPETSDNAHLLELIRLQSGKGAQKEVKYISHDELRPSGESLLEQIRVSKKGKESGTMMKKYAKLASFIALSRLLPGPSLMMMGADSFSDYRWECADPQLTTKGSKPAVKVTVQAEEEARTAFFKELQKTIASVGELVSCKLLHSQSKQSAATYELRGKNMTVIVVANFSSKPYISNVKGLERATQAPLSLHVERVGKAKASRVLFETSDYFV